MMSTTTASSMLSLQPPVVAPAATLVFVSQKSNQHSATANANATSLTTAAAATKEIVLDMDLVVMNK